MAGKLEEIFKGLRERQMFDPPYEYSILILGCPICFIPNGDVKYRDFIDRWNRVGRKAPEIAAQEWSSVSGPWVMAGRTEIITREIGQSFTEDDREIVEGFREEDTRRNVL